MEKKDKKLARLLMDKLLEKEDEINSDEVKKYLREYKKYKLKETRQKKLDEISKKNFPPKIGS